MNSPQRTRLRDLLPYIAQMKPFWLLLMTGFLLNLVALVSSVGLIALSGWFLSASAVAGLSLATLHAFNFFLPSAGVRFFAITRTISRYGERVTTHEGTLKLLSVLRRRIYERIAPLSPTALQRMGSGELMTRITTDVDALDNLYLRVLIPTFVALCAVLLCGGVIGYFAWPIGLLAGLALLVSGILGPWLAWARGQTLSDEWQQRDAHLRRRLLEQLASLPELLLYGQWQRTTQHLLKAQCHRDGLELTLARQWGQSQWLQQTLLGLTISGTLGLAAWWTQTQGLDATLVALMGLTVLGAFEAIAMLPQAWQHLGKIQRAAQRIDDLTHQVPEITFPTNDLAHPNGYALTLNALHVRFGAQRVLDGVSLHIPEGQHLALLGPSGSGKTTLLNTLVRFIEPTQGERLLGGVALHRLSEPTLRRQFAVAPQDVQLFSASLRDNLLLACPDADDATLISLLNALALGDWLDSLPDGLDSWPDEGGSSLSGGQLRRFGLARALLARAPIVMLDEPTEGLDMHLQAQVMAEIHRRCHGRTLIVITHQLQSLETFDHVVMFDQGRVIEQGTPQGLQQAPESYLSSLMRRLLF